MRDFVLLTKIGDGAYSEVYKVKRNSDSKVYALKKVSYTQTLVGANNRAHSLDG